MFFVIPMTFFLHKNEDESIRYSILRFSFIKLCNVDLVRNGKGVLHALCYTGGSLLILAVLLSIGFFVPTRDPHTTNSTSELENLLDDLETTSEFHK